MTEFTEPEPTSKSRVVVRLILLALGIIGIIIVAAMRPDAPDPTVATVQPKPPASEPITGDPVEPAPLVFQPNIAPADAEAMNAMRRDFAGPIIAAKPLIAPRDPARQADVQRAVDCLSQAIYYEAASESAMGQRAVAQVVLNRVRDPRYPSSVCGVVYQGSDRRTGCQFTFTCDGALARKPDPFLFTRAHLVAVAALSGRVEPLVGLATHYHTKQVVPYWRTDLVKLRTIGAHIFYGWQGREKSAGGLRTSYAGIEPMIEPAMLTPDLPVDMLPTIDAVDNGTSPFAAQRPTSQISGPKLPVKDFGQIRADETTGKLAAGDSGFLEADAKSGKLKQP